MRTLSFIGKFATLAVAMGVAVGAETARAEATATSAMSASAYVQDGLVAMWDGIENAGWGLHDSAPTCWKNLASGASDATLPEGAFTINDNYIAFSKSVATVTDVSCASNTGSITLEARIRPTSAKTSYDIPCLKIDGRGQIGHDGRTKNGMAVFVPTSANFGSTTLQYHWFGGWSYDTDALNKIYTLSAVLPISSSTTLNNVAFRDGVDLGKDCVGQWTSAVKPAPTGDATIGNAGVSHDIFVARVYNRALSAKEIAWNAMIDRHRFEDAALDDTISTDTRKVVDGKVMAPVLAALNDAELGDVALTIDGVSQAVGTEVWAEVGTHTYVYTATPKTGGVFVRWEGDVPDGKLRVASITSSVPLRLTAVFYAEGETTTRYRPIEFVEGKAAQWIDTEQTLKCGQTFKIRWSQNPDITYINAGCNGAWSAGTWAQGWQGAGFKQAKNYEFTVYHNAYLGFSPAWGSGNFVLGDVYEDAISVWSDFFSYTMQHEADGKTGNLNAVVNGDGEAYETSTSIALLKSTARNQMSYKRVHSARLFDTKTGEAAMSLIPVIKEEDQDDGTVKKTVMMYDLVTGNEVTNQTKTALIAGEESEADGVRWKAGKMEVKTELSVSGEGTFTLDNVTDQTTETLWSTRGAQISVTAKPSEGYTFVGWGGEVGENNRAQASITISADRARKLVARFAPTATANDRWVFSPTGSVTHAGSGIMLKAKLGMSSLSVNGILNLGSETLVDLNQPIYNEEMSATYTITAIGGYAFYGNTQITHVKLPDTVTTIGASAFQGCTSLAFFRMSQNIVTIGSDAFKGAGIEATPKLLLYPEPVFPPTLTSIGNRAFYFSWFTNETVVISNPKFTSWASQPFGRTCIKVLDLRDIGVTTTGDSIVYDGKRLKRLYFPKVLESITSTGNFLGNCPVMTGIYFSGDPITYAAANCMNYLTSTAVCWYLPKWNKEWEAYLDDSTKAQLTEMTSKDCGYYVANHGNEAMPVVTMKMSTPNADIWVSAPNPMGVRWWYPDPPPTNEDVDYFDILAWEGTNAVTTAGAETLVDGTTWTANNLQTQYVWSNAANASITIELPEVATNARALKLTGYRLRQACIEKYNNKINQMPNGRAPTAWKLEGQLTASGDWVTIHEVTSMTKDSAQHWAYMDYDDFSETVPARTAGVLTYEVAGNRQEAYKAFRFTPTKSYNTENEVADATPIALMEIEFVGQVTLPEPEIASFEHALSGWNSLTFTGNVAGLGDDLAKGEHATSALGWVEVAEDADFATIVSVSDQKSVYINTDQSYEVASLAGKSNYWARLVVSNDLDGVSVKALESSVATLDQPWDAEQPVCSYDDDTNVVVNVSFTAKYCAGDLTVKVYGSSSLTGEYTLLATTNCTEAGLYEIATGWTSDSASACVRVEITGDGVTGTTVAGVQGFWIANAASGPTQISNLVTRTTFTVTSSSTNLTLTKLVSLGDSTKVDFSKPIVSIDGSQLFAIASIGTVFKQNADLSEIILPDYMTTIPNSAFYSCYGLKKVHLPLMLNKIDQYAFYDCANMSEIEPCLPQFCTNLGASAFYNCDSLKAIHIPEGTTALASSLFLQCSNLGDVWLPDSLVTLTDGAFWECTSLSNVYPRPIPHNVTFVGVRTYKFCNKLLPKVLVADCEGTLTLSEESFNRTHPVVVDLGGCGGLKLAGNSSLASGDSGETSFRRLVLPPNVNCNGYKILSTSTGCECVTNITFTGYPPINIGTTEPFLSVKASAMYVVPASGLAGLAWRNYVAEHPEWTTPVTNAVRAAFKKAFPGERRIPKIKLQLGGVGEFRYLQLSGPLGNYILIR